MLEKLSKIIKEDSFLRKNGQRNLFLGIASVLIFLFAIYLGPLNGAERLGLIGLDKQKEKLSLAADCDNSYPDDHFRICYYNGIDLSGTFLGSVEESSLGTPVPENGWGIDHDWGGGSIYGGLTNYISAVWRGRINFTNWNYVLTTESNDGIRVYVDDQLILDEWRDQPGTAVATVSLSGYKNIRIEWYERSGPAEIRVGWDKVPKQAVINPSQANFDLYILKRGDLCVVGNPPTVGSETVNVYNPDGSVYMAFEKVGEQLPKVLKPSDPTVNDYPQKVCLSLGFSDAEEAEISGSFETFIQNVTLWSYGAIQPSYRIIPLSKEAILHNWGGNFYWAGWTLSPIAADYVSANSDFVFGVNSFKDINNGRYIPSIGACGITYGGDLGVGGASYAWIGCTTPYVFAHEWLHELDWSIHELMGFNDIYLGDFPPCGNGSAERRDWFPSSDAAQSDPDSPWCGGATSRGDFNAHIVSEHYDASMSHYNTNRILGNHCRNGIRDFGEGGVDEGGNCPVVTPTPTPSPTPSPTPTPTPTSSPTPSPSPPPPAGCKKADLNCDGKINIFDASILMSNWGKTGNIKADLNGNGRVDIFDASILMTNWGK